MLQRGLFLDTTHVCCDRLPRVLSLDMMLQRNILAKPACARLPARAKVCSKRRAAVRRHVARPDTTSEPVKMGSDYIANSFISGRVSQDLGEGAG